MPCDSPSTVLAAYRQAAAHLGHMRTVEAALRALLNRQAVVVAPATLARVYAARAGVPIDPVVDPVAADLAALAHQYRMAWGDAVVAADAQAAAEAGVGRLLRSGWAPGWEDR